MFRHNLRIDYRKAYDLVSHSWIFEVLRMYIAVKRGKVVDSADVSLHGGTIEALPMSASYKYLGALESDMLK